jgi:hypothetical protein
MTTLVLPVATVQATGLPNTFDVVLTLPVATVFASGSPIVGYGSDEAPTYQVYSRLIDDSSPVLLPVTGGSYTRVFDEAGEAVVTIPVHPEGETITADDIQPGYRFLYIYRNGVLQFGGRIWNYEGDSESITVHASGWYSEFRRAYLFQGDVLQYPNHSDPWDVAWDVIQYFNQGVRAIIQIGDGRVPEGKQFGLELYCGKCKWAEEFNWWEARTLADILEGLAGQWNHEWDFEITPDKLWVPSRRWSGIQGPGNPGNQSPYTIGVGNVEGGRISYNRSAELLADQMFARGGGTDAKTLWGVDTDSSLVADLDYLQGFVDTQYSHQKYVDGTATRFLRRFKLIRWTNMQVDVKASAQPFDAFQLGQNVLIDYVDGLHEVNDYFRLVSRVVEWGPSGRERLQLRFDDRWEQVGEAPDPQ